MAKTWTFPLDSSTTNATCFDASNGTEWAKIRYAIPALPYPSGRLRPSADATSVAPCRSAGSNDQLGKPNWPRLLVPSV